MRFNVKLLPLDRFRFFTEIIGWDMHAASKVQDVAVNPFVGLFSWPQSISELRVILNLSENRTEDNALIFLKS